TGNATVSFEVTSGPNKGLALSCTVTAALLGASTCSVSYSSTVSGTDTLVATAGAGDPGAQATVTWQGIPSFIVMSPAVSYHTMGGTGRVTATVIDRQGGAVPGANVAFSASGTGS